MQIKQDLLSNCRTSVLGAKASEIGHVVDSLPVNAAGVRFTIALVRYCAHSHALSAALSLFSRRIFTSDTTRQPAVSNSAIPQNSISLLDHALSIKHVVRL